MLIPADVSNTTLPKVAFY